MPAVMVSASPSRELYDRVDSELKLSESRPDGLIVHAASETSDGTVEIVDVWESVEAMRRFQEDRLFPAFQAAGVMELVQQAGPPTPREPFHYVG